MTAPAQPALVAGGTCVLIGADALVTILVTVTVGLGPFDDQWQLWRTGLVIAGLGLAGVALPGRLIVCAGMAWTLVLSTFLGALAVLPIAVLLLMAGAGIV